MSDTLDNALLVNPDTGRPFSFREPAVDPKGEPVPDPQTGQPVTHARTWTLFEFILRTLGGSDARGATFEDIECYGSVARKIRAALGPSRGRETTVAGQQIALDGETHKWLLNQCRNIWPSVSNKDICVAAWEQLTGRPIGQREGE